VTGPPDVLPLPELLLLELEDAQAARTTAAAQAAAGLRIVECFTLVLLYSVRAVRRCPASGSPHQFMRPM
jgi:hypothetical protein